MASSVCTHTLMWRYPVWKRDSIQGAGCELVLVIRHINGAVWVFVKERGCH